jgi:esterase/lipase superfamily enzyme
MSYFISKFVFGIQNGLRKNRLKNIQIIFIYIQKDDLRNIMHQVKDEILNQLKFNNIPDDYIKNSKDPKTLNLCKYLKAKDSSLTKVNKMKTYFLKFLKLLNI